MTENEISYQIRGVIFKVFNNLGPGLLESAYEAALLYELGKCGISAKSQIGLPLNYDGINMDVGYRVDLLVEDKVIFEFQKLNNFGWLVG